jgi:hypothetical protein
MRLAQYDDIRFTARKLACGVGLEWCQSTPGRDGAHYPHTHATGPWAAGGDRLRISGYQEAGDNVARYIAERDLRDIVLVGHSGGGIAISKAVELIAER